MAKAKVAILTSAVGLGVYIPAILLKRHLSKKNISVNTFLFEGLFDNNSMMRLRENKIAFQANYTVAKVAYRMPAGMQKHINEDKLNFFFKIWEKEKIELFVVFSGHWLAIINQYQENFCNADVNVECCLVDSNNSPSWDGLKNYPGLNLSVSRIFDSSQNKVNFSFPIDTQSMMPFNERTKRILVHGGGWNLGDYHQKIQELNQRSPLEIWCIEKNPVDPLSAPLRQSIFQDNQWNPWNKDFSDNGFPPIVVGAETIAGDKFHPLYSIICDSLAIVSKPGGMSLVDSFSSETPIIFLPGLDHELSNLRLWTQLEFGQTYEQWILQDCSIQKLRHLHENIRESKTSTRSYFEFLIEKYF